MQIGAMNNPARPVEEEIERIARLGFGMLDLTVEGPKALNFDVRMIDHLLTEHRLDVVGHTDPNLPYAYPVDSVREACLHELERCAAIFAELGATVMNIHPCYQSSPRMKRYLFDLNREALGPIAEMAGQYGLTLALENLFPPFDSVMAFERLFKHIPNLALHLDVGHANLGVDGPPEFCRAFGSKLVHVHLSDNRGTGDAHMPLGAGRIDWKQVIPAIRNTGFDGAITLEVFCNDNPDYDVWTSHYLQVSRSIVEDLWG